MMTTISQGGDARSLAAVLAHIAANLDEPLPLDDLAAISGLSVWRFATVFRERIGMAPHRYVSLQRVRYAQALLREGAALASAASESGFCDQSHLSRRFKRLCGITPGQYQARSAASSTPHL
ncbi:AraC family transcriptional regulator [Polaromonas sp. C04]|uniref:helix-turn-helix domain-containing protein n=1 Tax=Polaromonas sp. C04 TaxID=1945857 RepID=UPI0025704EA3|nr:AraC family transcriptional regulator [Polaromonas sp. C04]